MIGEAIDAAFTLGWALAAWIAVAAFVGAVVVLAGLACGTWAVKRAWRSASTVKAPRRAPGARLSDEQPAEDPIPPGTVDGRTAPRWAHDEREAA